MRFPPPAKGRRTKLREGDQGNENENVHEKSEITASVNAGSVVLVFLGGGLWPDNTQPGRLHQYCSGDDKLRHQCTARREWRQRDRLHPVRLVVDPGSTNVSKATLKLYVNAV